MMREELRELLKKEFPKIIKETRENCRITQEQMSERLQMDNRSLQDLEAGKSIPNTVTYIAFRLFYPEADFSSLDAKIAESARKYNGFAK